jgi:hypothetical protein
MTTWRKFLLLSICLFLVLGGLVAACGDDDDDDDAADDDETPDDDTPGDDDTSTDDDDDDDDDNDDDDDDNDNDDDDDTTPPPDYSCSQVADGVYNTCGLTLRDAAGNPVNEAGLVTWCGLSEALFPVKAHTPFWDCLGNCTFEEDCDMDCFDVCLDPPDPGEVCGTAVDSIYACDVVFLFTGTDYYIPEADLQQACAWWDGMNWACAQTCAEEAACSDPPTQAQTLQVIACMGDCGL